MKNTFVVSGLRSPIGKLGGALSNIRADDLLSIVIKAVVSEYPQIEWASSSSECVIGCANQAGEDNRNIARMSLLLADLPITMPGKTVNRLCASGLSAIVDVARAIQVDEASIALAGGVEHMTRAPYVLSKSHTPYDRSQKMYDSTFGWRFINPQVRLLQTIR
jgi:acetyl-CoA acetyltransferase